MKKSALVALGAPFFMMATSVAVAEGSRPVVMSDLSQKDTDFKYRTGNPYAYLRATADFDGDGVGDEAQIYKKGDFYQLVVTLQGGRKDKVHILKQGYYKEIDHIGVETVQAGSFSSACRKGYGKKCKEGQSMLAGTKNTGIKFFVFEKFSQLYHWKDGKFRSFLLTD